MSAALGETPAADLRVLHLQRRPFPGYFSIEGQFEEIRHAMRGVDCRKWECPHLSRGILPRVANTLAARRLKADVYHVTGDVHYLSLGLPKERTLLTIHDCVFASQTRGLRRILLRKAFYEWAVARAARVTVISETIKRELTELLGSSVPVGGIEVVPCCLPARFAYSPREFSKVPEVLLVGTTPNKNLTRVLGALFGLKCRVHVVGRMNAEQNAAAEGLELRNSVSLVGDAMVNAYREADLVALVSTYEGFGLPIIEAQAVGRPVITSSVSSMPEAAGGAALLVDPLDTAAIRAGFARLFEDTPLRKALVARGIENAAKYDPGRVASKYADIYRQLNTGNAN